MIVVVSKSMKKQTAAARTEILVKDQYLKELVELLVEHYHPLKIYLFGSKARGDARAHSDYDLMVVVPKEVSWTKRDAFHHAKWEAGLTEATDILFFSSKSFEEQRELKASLPFTVLEEGKILYEAS